MISFFTKSLLFAGGLYLLLLLALYLGQRRLIYAPNPERVAPMSLGLLDVSEVSLKVEPDVRLLAWFGEAKPGHPTILYFHGNGGNLAGRADRIKQFQDGGFGILIMSYRSYSGSSGAPSEEANIRDALHAYDWLGVRGIGADRIVLFGESLGTGVASQVASKRGVAGVILDAPYSSFVDIASFAYPYVPVRLLLQDRYQSDQHIAKIDAPLLIMHGAKDEVIPVSMGKALFMAAIEPKKIIVFPNGGHTDLFDHGAMAEVRAFMEGLK